MRKKLEDYIGDKYKFLTITGIDRERMKSSKHRDSFVFADCECGIIHKSYNLNKIKRGETKSCGHLKIKHETSTKSNKFEMFEDYGIIQTSNGDKFYFDLEDYSILKDKYWYSDDYGYLTNCEVINGSNIYKRFHRLIMNEPYGLFVDHIDKDNKNNKKCNLRICEHKENDRNKNPTSRNISGVVGVYFDKSRNKWKASITYNYKSISLGRFDDKKDAIIARLKAENKYFKEFSPQKHLFEKYGIKGEDNV